MEKIYKIVLWAICSVLLSHNSACVSIATGALEGAIEKQERTNRIEAAATAVGFDEGEFDTLGRKIDRAESCTNTIENDYKYYPLQLKSPDNPTYKHFQDTTYITSEERKILAWYIEAGEICFDIFRHDTYRSPLVAEFQLIMDRAFLETLVLFAKLDNGEITWGQFNREGKLFEARLKDRIEAWKSKFLNKTAQIASIVAIQEEQIYIQRQRQAYQRQLQMLQSENRRLQNEQRDLERCAMFPGQYGGCPPIN